MADLSLYAGHWITLGEAGDVVSVAHTAAEARVAGRQQRPKERLRLLWITPHPPHLALPAWPFEALHPQLPADALWLVGGAVRDLLLQRELHDWDFAVAGATMPLARRIANAIGGAYVTLDAEHDTARVVVKDPATQVPITLDFAALRGGSIEDDLRWRDFTVNALALTLDGRLIDTTGGLNDLTAQQIRATSDATFTQDPARLLRAVRCAGELGFNIEAHTLTAIRRHAPLIETVAAERTRVELLRILQLIPAAPTLRLADGLGLLAYVLPELTALHTVAQSRPHHYASAWEHTLAAVSAVEGVLATLMGRAFPAQSCRTVNAPPWAWELLQKTLGTLQKPLCDYLGTLESVEMSRADLLKWGALLHDIGKTDTRTVDEHGLTHFYGHTESGEQRADTRLSALRFPNKAREFVAALVAGHMRLATMNKEPPTRRAMYRFYRDTGAAGVSITLLTLADTLAVWGPTLQEQRWERLLDLIATLLHTYFTQQEEIIAPRPLLTGADLLALEIPQGPRIGALLAQLREAQAAGEITTREEALALVQKLMAEE